MKKALLFLPLIAFSLASCEQTKSYNALYEEFSFSLDWGVQYDSSYNSKSEQLISFKNVRDRKIEEYTTTYKYPYLEDIYNLVKKMNPYSYPDTFDPFNTKKHIMSTPATNYKLVVGDKTIEVKNFPIDIGTDEKGLSNKGIAFVDLVNTITKTIQSSDEWKALPEPEYYYS